MADMIDGYGDDSLFVTALQVLKSKERPLVSSVFFMCLPDKVSLLVLPPFTTVLRPELIIQHALLAQAKLDSHVTSIRSMHTGTYPEMAMVNSCLVSVNKHDLGWLIFPACCY